MILPLLTVISSSLCLVFMHIQVCRATDSSEIRSILKNLKAMFGKLFDYVETEEEFNDSVNHIKKYERQ